MSSTTAIDTLSHAADAAAPLGVPSSPLGVFARVGYWSAVLTGLFSVSWAIVIFLQQRLWPVPPWQGAPDYLEQFDLAHMWNFYPSLLLAVSFVVLLASIHVYASPSKKVSSLAAFGVGLIYAAMGSIHYNIQLVTVRQALLSGQTDGVELYLQSHPYSLLYSLGNAYVYMALAMLFAAFVFSRVGLERWIRLLFIIIGVATPVGMLAYTMFDAPVPVLGVLSVPWLIGTPLVAGLLAVRFRRITKDTEGTQSHWAEPPYEGRVAGAGEADPT